MEGGGFVEVTAWKTSLAFLTQQLYSRRNNTRLAVPRVEAVSLLGYSGGLRIELPMSHGEVGAAVCIPPALSSDREIPRAAAGGFTGLIRGDRAGIRDSARCGRFCGGWLLSHVQTRGVKSTWQAVGLPSGSIPMYSLEGWVPQLYSSYGPTICQ